MKNLKGLFPLLFMGILLSNTNAQHVGIEADPYKTICEFLDPNKITTDFLGNQTWPLSTIPLLTGTEQDTINADIFKQLFFDL